MSTVFLNGQWGPIENATVSVLDRGFIFGDGIYEVIPVHRRKPYRMRQHLTRLQYSLDGIRIANPYSVEEWIQHIEYIIAQQPFDNQAVYIQVTRGPAPRNHAFPEVVTPTVFMMSNPLKSPSAEQIEHGVRAISVQDQRWLHCDYKTTSLLGNVLAYQHAIDHQAVEVVQFRNGFLSEAAACNVMIVREGTIIAPQKNHLILHGITMDGVLEAAHRIGVPVKQEDIKEETVRTADELWLTSSTRDILAITTLDGHRVGSGVPGLVFKRVLTALQEDIEGASHGT